MLVHRRTPSIALVTTLAALGLGPLLAGCSDDKKEITDPPSNGSVTFDVRHVVGGDGSGGFVDLELGKMGYRTAAENTFAVNTLIYYISDVTLVPQDGEPYVTDAVRLIDARDPASLTFTIDGIPAGHYHGIRFTFGVRDEINDNDLFERGLPPHVVMEWPDNWGGGYHYMKLEGSVLDDEALPLNFTTHTGRFDDGTVGPYPHFFALDLEAHMDVVANEATEVELIHDIKEWYEDPHVIDLMDHTTGIMANQPMQDLLEANGASVFRLGGIGHDGRLAR